MKAELEEVVATDGYGNKSEFFRALFRDYLKKRQQEKLEAKLIAGLESGDSQTLTSEVLEEIKFRALKRVEQIKSKKG